MDNSLTSEKKRKEKKKTLQDRKETGWGVFLDNPLNCFFHGCLLKHSPVPLWRLA